jgi:hypothetical protein
MSTEDKNERARQQAMSQYQSLVEMVRALDEDTYREDFVAAMTAEEKLKYMREDLDWDDERIEDADDDDIAQAIADGDEPDDYRFDEDEARQTIQEDALSVEVRSPWYSPCASEEDRKPDEFQILLCTGGPAVKIEGDLDHHGQPVRARLLCQDWFTSWEEVLDPTIDREVLLAYCREFYFGE